MQEMTPERARALRRRHRHERQAVVFGSMVAVLAVAGLGSAAVYTGVVSVPFLDRDFSTPEPEAVADVPAAPCPPDGTLPLAYASVQVTVLNGSGRTGLAGETATALTGRGFAVLTTGNSPDRLELPARITFGEAGLAAAYTLAAQLDQPLLQLDQRTDGTVDLVVGAPFAGLLDPATVVLDPAVPLTGVAGCVPLEEARAEALPAPTPTATPTTPAEGELQDGGEGFEETAPPEG